MDVTENHQFEWITVGSLSLLKCLVGSQLGVYPIFRQTHIYPYIMLLLTYLIISPLRPMISSLEISRFPMFSQAHPHCWLIKSHLQAKLSVTSADASTVADDICEFHALQQLQSLKHVVPRKKKAMEQELVKTGTSSFAMVSSYGMFFVYIYIGRYAHRVLGKNGVGCAYVYNVRIFLHTSLCVGTHITCTAYKLYEMYKMYHIYDTCTTQCIYIIWNRMCIYIYMQATSIRYMYVGKSQQITNISIIYLQPKILYQSYYNQLSMDVKIS